MKVVQFRIGSFGGAERFFFKLAGALNERGIEQHIIHNEHPAMRESALRSGIPSTEIPFPKGKIGLMSRIKFRQTIKAERPDILLCWGTRAARRAFAGNFATIARIGSGVKARDFRNCDHLVCNTPKLVDHMVSQGWPSERISMISNFGDLEPKPAIDRATIGVKSDDFVVLSLGRFDQWKGFDDMIAALPRLPENVVYVIAGQGDQEEAWRKLAEAEGVANRVRFIGWRDDQSALLAASDVCVVPSHIEPLSNVTVEAWSLGVPVVAARAKGPSWLIDDGASGMLVPIGSPEALAERIRDLYESPQLRLVIGEGGREKWQAEFSEDCICRQYIDLFQRLILRRREGARHSWQHGIADEALSPGG